MEPLPPPSDGDQNRGPLCIQVDAVLTSVAIVTTLLRLTTRLCTRHQGWDDFAIAWGLIFNVADFAADVLQVQSGFGRHQYYLTPNQIAGLTKWDDIGAMVSFAAIGFTKISICIFLLRIENGKRLKWFLWFLIAGLAFTSGSNIVVLLARCQPFDALWTMNGTCWSIDIIDGFNYMQVGWSIVSDLACSGMPIYIVYNLQMKLRLKIAICSLTGLGLLATACAVARAVIIPTATKSPDISWALVDLDIWVRAEDNIAIIAANMALSRIFYRFFRDLTVSTMGFFSGLWTSRHSTRPAKRLVLSANGSYISLENMEGNVINKTTDIDISQGPRGSFKETQLSQLGLSSRGIEDQV
ncbi:hypothetical protein MMC12_007434 [Toensbergia leucococca]|nr:hypothetical protein [Toensbergia leucococca]